MDMRDLKNIHMKNIDYVSHLAAISNDPAALLNSQITWETNVSNTYHLLELCKKNNVKKIYFCFIRKCLWCE